MSRLLDSREDRAGVLAGRSPGVELDETGHAQAERRDTLVAQPLQHVERSPVAALHDDAPAVGADRRHAGQPGAIERKPSSVAACGAAEFRA